MVTPALDYHVVGERERAGVLGLWSQTEWGEPRSDVREWYKGNPLPGSFVMGAQDADGRAVAQLVMMAASVTSHGTDYPAYCALAPIVDRTARDPMWVADPTLHPSVALYRHAAEEARSRGARVMYAMPHWKWAALFHRLQTVRYCTFPLWSRPLPLPRPESIGHGYSVSGQYIWDEPVNRLWTAASRILGTAITRTADILRWKVGLPGYYTVLAVEREGELVGIVAAHARQPGQWTVCDVLACDDDALRATLQATCNAAHLQAQMPDLKNAINKVSLLVTPALERVASSLGFVRDDYDFLLVVRALDSTLPAHTTDPATWYLSINDHG